MAHGYDFVRYEDHSFDKSVSPSWNKVQFCLRQLETSAWVFWTDCDSIVINQKIRLQDILRYAGEDQWMVICRDHRGVKTSNFLIKGCSKGRQFLQDLWKERFRYTTKHWEQDAVKALSDVHSHYWAGMKILPGYVMNSETDFTSGDFIRHFPNLRNEAKVEKIKLHLKNQVLLA